MSEGSATALREEIGPILASTAPLFMGTVLFFCLPLFVGAAADSLGLDTRQQGTLAAMDVGGATLAGLCSLWWIERVSWRRIGLLSHALLVVANLLSIGVVDLPTLFALRLVAGFNAGTIFAVSLAALGVQRDTDRAFAIAVTLQIALDAAVLYLLTGWIERWGFDGVLYCLAGLSALLAVPLRWIPSRGPAAPAVEHPVEAGSGAADLAGGPDWRGFASLASFGALILGVGAFWAFAERIGLAGGLSRATVGAALGTGVLVAAAGPLLASWLGSTRGLVGPMSIGVVATATAMVLFAMPPPGDYGLQYGVAAAVFQIGWNFTAPFLLAVIARADPRARLIAVSAAVQAGGATLGPPTAGFLAAGGSYGAVVVLGVVALALSLVLALPAALEQQRALRGT
jgi:predicted MFS family arabinose efflux permease